MNKQQTDYSLFSRLRFVLVNTSSPGNIGAAARAIKTMGFSQLVLVSPRFADAVHAEQAVAFASGALDVLESARVVETVEEALQGCNFAAAVSARLREFSPPVVTPRRLAAQLSGEASLEAALVFGNERFGLPNEVVQKCQALINIPANPDYSSLNLAQAVQVLAYECRMTELETHGGPMQTSGDARAPGEVGFQGSSASVTEIEGMFAHLEQALVAIDFLDPDNPRKLMPRLKRLFARAQLETEEVNILRGLARQILAPKAGDARRAERGQPSEGE
ncbi:RNA methyltransferase [Herbaspirillum sp. YR522]|uniref:RNA methyltransferase n=1 Tax=Herbaspirillum sp. YR522 TaxID=1144342 RepID=UPI00026FAAE3|nr:RNA methyltransferase [Herbaspirillum sp. YR522]EJN07828.1 RNA methyltransferase, TrmH family, group 1 [Herbaspirillum sp. YR522]